MSSYRRDWSDEVSSTMTGFIILAAIAIGIFIATVIICMVTELVRIYKDQAFQPTRTARILWLALAGLLTIWLVAGMLATSPDWAAPALYLGAWSFLIFCIVAEFCDISAGRQAQAELAEVGNLDTYLGAFPRSPNGHTEQPAQRLQ